MPVSNGRLGIPCRGREKGLVNVRNPHRINERARDGGGGIHKGNPG